MVCIKAHEDCKSSQCKVSPAIGTWSKLAQPEPASFSEAIMSMLIIRHRVKDYKRWRPGFDRHAKAQKSAGLTNPRVFRSSDDENEVVILFDTDDTKKAKDFVASPDLKATMTKAGVIDSPTFYFLESAERSRVMGMGWIELLGLHGEKHQIAYPNSRSAQ